MPDNKKKIRPEDATEIDIHEAYEVQYWTKKWNIEEGELVKAVDAVGVKVVDVAKYLGKTI